MVKTRKNPVMKMEAPSFDNHSQSSITLLSHDVSSYSRYEFIEKNRNKKSTDADVLESVIIKNRYRTPIPKINELLEKYKETKKFVQVKNVAESFYKIDANHLGSLKESTKKLISILDEIQRKTKCCRKSSEGENQTNEDCADEISELPDTSLVNLIGQKAMKKLEEHTKSFDVSSLAFQQQDDCSVYKKLTRKCYCLTNVDYNDFVIHFNEQSNIVNTSSLGEIIKNLRILRKFLYMGGDYSKRALLFLNEGLTDIAHAERVEIIQGCSYADICNVFEEHSIVTILIAWPCKYEYYGDVATQALTASFLYKLAQIEEGRRYLKFNSKIANDLKRVLRKKIDSLEIDTVETINETLNMMHPPLPNHALITYYCKPVTEGFGTQTMKDLIHHRDFMSFDEVFCHLDILKNISDDENGKAELLMELPMLLNLFKIMLAEYDNSEMNIIITSIINNIISKNMIEGNLNVSPKVLITSDAGTEPVRMKNMTCQIPPKKNFKKVNRSKNKFGGSSNKIRQLAKPKVCEWEPPRFLNRSQKFFEENQNKSKVIVIPLEKKKTT